MTSVHKGNGVSNVVLEVASAPGSNPPVRALKSFLDAASIPSLMAPSSQ
jgi:hypothetical protein